MSAWSHRDAPDTSPRFSSRRTRHENLGLGSGFERGSLRLAVPGSWGRFDMALSAMTAARVRPSGARASSNQRWTRRAAVLSSRYVFRQSYVGHFGGKNQATWAGFPATAALGLFHHGISAMNCTLPTIAPTGASPGEAPTDVTGHSSGSDRRRRECPRRPASRRSSLCHSPPQVIGPLGGTPGIGPSKNGDTPPDTVPELSSLRRATRNVQNNFRYSGPGHGREY